jgi:hypothetical protein
LEARVPVPQPAKGVLAIRRITNIEVARSLDPPVSPHYVGRVLNGFDQPSPRLRAAVVALTGLPEEALFRRSGASSRAS